MNNWAVFTNLEVPLTRQLTFTGGIRLSQETLKFHGCGAIRDSFSSPAFTGLVNFFRGANGLAAIPLIAPGQCSSMYTTAAALSRDTGGAQLFVPGFANRALRENNVPWNLNLNWKPSSRSLIYARVSRGYKAGNFSTLNTTDNVAYDPVVQEELTAYELGGRVSVSRWLRLEAAIFRYDYINKQLRARINVGPPFGNINGQANIPESRLKGAEFSVVLRPVNDLTLSASGVYIDSKILQFTGYTVDGVFQNLAGSSFNFTPKYSLNGDVNYTHRLTSDLEGFLGVNVAYRSKTSAVFAPPGYANLSTFDINGHTLVDGQIGVQSAKGNWRVWLWGNNIFNKYYITNVLRVSDVEVKFPGMPATYGITASIKF
jgi:outer membrane receptor protein involved in Fe transport